MSAQKLLWAGLQSGTIMGIADTTTQVFLEGKTMNANASVAANEYDAARTLRWVGLGMVLHGPYFFVGFSYLDRRFTSKGGVVSLKTVAKKTAAAQCFLFPPYLVALFGLLGILEDNADIAGKIQTRVPEAFVNGCVYWPIANSINFRLVPNTLRVPYLALSAGLWNSYLSYANQRGINNNGNRNNDEPNRPNET